MRSALGVLLAASAAADAAATSAPAHLGPGRGAWRVESPLKHGISPESMQRAAELMFSAEWIGAERAACLADARPDLTETHGIERDNLDRAADIPGHSRL